MGLTEVAGLVGFALAEAFVVNVIGKWSAGAFAVPCLLYYFRDRPAVVSFMTMVGLPIRRIIGATWALAIPVLIWETGMTLKHALFAAPAPLLLLLFFSHKPWRELAADCFFKLNPFGRVFTAALIAAVLVAPVIFSVYWTLGSSSRLAQRRFQSAQTTAVIGGPLSSDAAPVVQPTGITSEVMPGQQGASNIVANESEGQSPHVDENAKLELESRLTLFEFYPRYEWPLTGVASEEPQPVADGTLIAEYNTRRGDYRVTPLVRNFNFDQRGLLLFDPTITIRVPLAVNAKPTRLWAAGISGGKREFRTAVPLVPVDNVARGVNESLFLRFPGPGRYPVEYLISGIIDAVAVEARGSYTLELRGPTP